MGFLENLTNDAFANKMADHYHTHIGVAEFKSIKAEAKRGDNPRTPAWGAQPYLEKGMKASVNALTAPAFDSIRVGGFMASPKGLLFIAKQSGLQRTNPKGEYLIPGSNPGRSYNPASTLQQVLLGPLGIHIDRHGLGALNLEANNYEARIKKLNKLPTETGESNRLVSIASQLNLGYHKKLQVGASSFSKHGMTPFARFMSDLQDTNFYNKRSKVINRISGKGGANSLFGLGFTTIRTSTTTGLDGLINISYKFGESYQDQRSEEGDYVGAFGPHIEKLGETFNPTVIPAGSSENPLAKYQALNYGGIVKAVKNVSGVEPLKSFSTATGEGTKYDSAHGAYARIGLIDYGNALEDFEDDTYGELGGGTSDYCTLKLTSDSGKTIRLRSYGLGSITDNTSFNWSEVKYAGRTMAQYKFGDVSRDVSHNLTIVAFTSGELKQNMAKLNKLYQIASPSVDSGSGLASAPLVQLTLGDLYTNQNVIIDKITFTVDEDTPWDIGFGGVAELPMIVKLNLGYKLITNAGGEFFTNSSTYWNPVT